MEKNKKLQYAKKDTSLAKKRSKLSQKSTILSATRTFLSYIRTSLVFISVALAFMKLDKENPIDVFTIILFALSAIFLVVGIFDFIMSKKMVHNLYNTEDLDE